MDVRPAGQRVVRSGRCVSHDVSDGVHPALAPRSAEERARARRLRRRGLGGDPARQALRCARDGDGELAGEARVRERGRRGCGDRLRRDRRPPRRRRDRPGRGRRLHAFASDAEPARDDRRDRVHRRALARPERAVARRPERFGVRLLPRPADEATPGVRARTRGRAARAVVAGRDRPARRRDLPALGCERRACPDRDAQARRQGRARTVKAVVTGGEGGLGRAMRRRLEHEGYAVESLDLVNGFDVTDPGAWDVVGPVDLAVLNAGILTAERDIRVLTPEQYREAVAVNVDGVVLGVRRLAQVMERGGTIVATASLAGLVGMPLDPIYSLTKHAVVGFVRSIAPSIAPVKINAICPGIADTPMLDQHDQRALFAEAGFPLLQPEEVADAMWR